MTGDPMANLRRTPFHRVLHRSNLLLGGDRELVLFTAVLCGGLAVSAMNLVAAGIAATVWFSCIGVLYRMGKADPLLVKVYHRQVRYAAWYPARSRPWRRNRRALWEGRR